METKMGIQELADEICQYCRSAVGDEVRSVVRYNSHEHDPVYTREDIPQQLQMDEETRMMFRTPFIQMNKTVWQLSELSPTLADPEFMTLSFADILVIMFPVTVEEGIVVSFDREGELPEDLIDGCKDIVYGSG